jgi:uncharacterized protein (TIGR02147 family)
MSDKRLPPIFTFFDFRAYLEAYREKRKELEPGFKHEYICRRLGQVNSKSYFANVVKGVKNVTPEFVNRFIDLLELDADEARYFRTLVQYNQTCNPKEKEYLLKQLIRQSAAQSRLISENEYAFYEEWHHGVIRAILDVFDFRDDFRALADAVIPPLSVPQVKKSIALLRSLQLIAPDKNGFLRPTEKTIKTHDYVRDNLIRQYRLQCLEMAKLMCIDKPERPEDIYTHLLSVSEKGFKEVQERIRVFRDEIRAIVRNDTLPADRVYNLYMQLFPNSKINTARSVD